MIIVYSRYDYSFRLQEVPLTYMIKIVCMWAQIIAIMCGLNCFSG